MGRSEVGDGEEIRFRGLGFGSLVGGFLMLWFVGNREL